MSSIFTKIIKGEIPSYTLLEDDMCIAFLDIFPITKGHTLVVPKIEIDRIFDLPNSYLQHILTFAQPIAKAIEKAYPCNRVNIITVGLEVPHAHIHLIPTHTLSDVNLSKSKLSLTPIQLKEIQQKIQSFLG